MGQLGTYVTATDDILRAKEDNQTIGLLICKSKDNVLAKYAVNTVNVPVGICCGADDCANYSNNIMRVRLKDSVDSEFINTLLNLNDYQSFIKRTSKGGTDKRALSKSLIGSYPIIVPPIELQNQFADFVKQVDKSKFFSLNVDKARYIFSIERRKVDEKASIISNNFCYDCNNVCRHRACKCGR